MSSYIQFIIAYLSRERSSLISDRPAIEIILSKVIQIDHIELFFRFLEAIMLNTTLQEFNQSGYMGIFISGSQAIGQSIQGKKATLLFTSKLILQYGNTQQTLGYVHSVLDRSITAVQVSTIRFSRLQLIFCNPFRQNHIEKASSQQSARQYR